MEPQQPEVIFESSALKTESDWSQAGEIVFDAPILYDDVTTASDVRDPAWYRDVRVPVANNGTMPFARYVIREKGKVELGNNACAFCHTRVMPDGSVTKGAQGNFPFDRAIAFRIRR